MARKAKQSKGKKMNPTFFVFCEGKTEAAYVDLLRRNFRVPVEIVPLISDSNIFQAYIERCKHYRFSTDKDKTFLMFDLDVSGMLERLRQIKGVILLLSNPCIEYWFLLHYRDISKELTSAECLSCLKRLAKDYVKGIFSSSLSRMLIENREEATLRAKEKNNFDNPSSTVHLLLEEIEAFIFLITGRLSS